MQYYDGLKMLGLRVVNEELKGNIEGKVHALLAGTAGEQRLEEIFNKYTLPFPYKVLFNVNLTSHAYFQIDCLLVSPKFLLVLESKNISGQLSFDENPDWLIRVRENGTVDVFESPEVQVARNKWLLQEWLIARGYDIPVFGAIVWTTGSLPNMIKSPKSTQSLFVKSVPTFVLKVWESYERVALHDTELSSLIAMIKHESKRAMYVPFPIAPRWNIRSTELLFGIRCLQCNRIGMTRYHRGWICNRCDNYDKEAHKVAIQEWFVLLKETMTNRECREFLQIDDRYLAKRLLKSCDVIEIGTTKGTVYKWNWK
ncbi:nuclease-related domain-containing protein [Lysinibacillus sp. 54212]|uniref:nuclease-related domain-containing protein n=1 Tax=Lysinibacillus sp. 54212 TaxID=3119829 RepID=UPI002FC8B4B4